MKPFLKREPYTGPVQAIILDWAGTTVDHGCRGPVAVFSRAFEQYGIVPTVEEVRGPMGKDKREHVQCMLHMDRIAALWKEEHGALPDESVTDKIYSLVQELMPETLADYATHHPDAIRLCLELTSMFRKLERAGDHINNLAEETVFYIDAEVLKHRRAQRPEPEAE